ncbi:hypothetical protein EUGRSUZ_B02387 [Eucalyptus grandis]|uniref:Uncharacterized protein n=2 Tax=Eucalyptus grandis TaxID=71139 RepID=A0ACC3LTH8_EUCGR|nr:hypothetical protein EUGRSUZ_B02387 [Eucalyptus grandis]
MPIKILSFFSRPPREYNWKILDPVAKKLCARSRSNYFAGSPTERPAPEYTRPYRYLSSDEAGLRWDLHNLAAYISRAHVIRMHPILTPPPSRAPPRHHRIQQMPCSVASSDHDFFLSCPSSLSVFSASLSLDFCRKLQRFLSRRYIAGTLAGDSELHASAARRREQIPTGDRRSAAMGVPSHDAVLIQKPKKPGEPHVITVNCPDKTGLGCDICRTILDFGLCITKGDISTDGIWCYIVLWVLPHTSTLIVKWSNLKDRLMSACPSSSVQFYLDHQPAHSTSSPVYLLKFLSLDRKGLLHDVTRVLCELELTIQRVKVMTTPDERVLDLFFITDNMDLLHTKKRQDQTCEQLYAVLGESCISCELQLAGPEYGGHQAILTLSPAVAEELFRCEPLKDETYSRALTPDLTKLKKTTISADNTLSPAHTLLQIHSVDHKGLLYDIMRTLKDCSIQQTGGKKIVDPEKQSALISRLKLEMLHPLRVIISSRGPDTELLVANPVELSGKGRPRVFYDVTLALKMLGICIFSAEIGRHFASDREWEVYKFLLEASGEFQFTNAMAKNQIVDRVRRTLMGW